MDERKKFSGVEIVLGSLGTLIIDFFCLILDAFFIGIIVSPVIQGTTTFGLWLWFKNKGDPDVRKVGRQVAKYLANFLPVVPTTFFIFITGAVLHNRAAGKNE